MTYEDDLEFQPPVDAGYPEGKQFLVAACVAVVGTVAFFIYWAVFG